LLSKQTKIREPNKKKRNYDLMTNSVDAAKQVIKRREIEESKQMVVDDSASIRQRKAS
jgi:hypothetical protein